MSEIERDKLSLPELKGFLGDHLAMKESMKLYFHHSLDYVAKWIIVFIYLWGLHEDVRA